MKLETKKAKSVATILNMLSKINPEVYFEMNEDGIRISAMDPAHVCMIFADITKPFFEDDEYKFEGEEGFGLDLKPIVSWSAFRIGDKFDGKLKISSVDNQFNIVLDDPKWVTKKKKETMISLEKVKKPEIKYNFEADVTVDLTAFRDMLDTIMIGKMEHATFSCSKDIFETYVSEIGEDTKASVLVNEKLFPNYRLEKDKVVGTYLLEYIKTMVDLAANIVTTAELQFTENKPMKMSFRSEGFALEMLLAPYVTQDK